MKKLSKKFKSGGLLKVDRRSLFSILLLGVLMTSVFLPLYQPHEVDAAREDTLCVPRNSPASGTGSEDDWNTDAFRFVFLSRFSMRTGYNETGNCASPSSLSSRYIHDRGIAFAPFANQVLKLVDTNDDDLFGDTRIYGGEGSDGGDRDESIIRVENWPEDKSTGWELYRNRLTPTIDSYFRGARYTIGIEEDLLDGAATCAGNDSNFHLINEDDDGKGVKWRCDDDSLNERGSQVTGHLEEKEKFNIVFKVSEDGSSIDSLNRGASDEFNFQHCENSDTYKNEGCNGEAQINDLTKEQALAIGEGTKLVDIKGTSVGFVQSVVAGPGNEVSVPDDDGGGGGNDDDGPPSCEEINPGISLSWFICSVINFLDDTIAGLNSAVIQLLTINKDYYTDSGLKEAWAYFRNIASFLLIIIGLVMIIGQAINKG